MGRRDPSERKLTKPNSGRSLASQSTQHRPTTAPQVHSTPTDITRDATGQTSPVEREVERSILPQQSINDINMSREKSNMNLKDIWASVPQPILRTFYKLHNPLGPRWYRNHHLIPLSHLKPSMRPPTFFSPSFPPIGASSSPDYHDEGDETSRTPSHSTPDSSQTRVQDGLKPRSRKTSQTTPDAIDLLDLSDPWGQNWHHQSPYEFGQTTTFVSLDTYDVSCRHQVEHCDLIFAF